MNASWIEILWTAVAFCGLVFSASNARDAIRDLRVVAERGIHDGRRVFARSAAITEILRCVVQAIFVLIGFAAMLVPDPPQSLHGRSLFVSAVVKWGLVTCAFLVVGMAASIWIARRRLFREGD